MGFWDAFALNPPPDQDDDEAARTVAKKIVEKGMAAPAIFMLESIKPFTFLLSQAAIGFEPLAAAFISTGKYEKLPKFLEKRENIELVIRYIEDYSVKKPGDKEAGS